MLSSPAATPEMTWAALLIWKSSLYLRELPNKQYLWGYRKPVLTQDKLANGDPGSNLAWQIGMLG